MKEISLRVDELQTICAKNKIIGQGSYGIVYKLDDDTLFKFNYKDIGVFEFTCSPYPSDDQHKVVYKGSGLGFTFYEPGKCYVYQGESLSLWNVRFSII